METFLCTCNSYPRSRHAEADAQVTLEALCLLHNAPAQIQGRERRNGWFLDRTVSTQINICSHPTLITNQMCTHSCFGKHSLAKSSKADQPRISHYIHTYTTSLHIRPDWALRREERYSTINTDHSLTQNRHRKPQVCISTCHISPLTGATSALSRTAQSCCNWRSST